MISRLWQRAKGHRWFWRGLQVFLIVVPLWFLVQSLQQNWDALAEYRWQLDPTSMIAAVVVLACAFGFLPLASQQALTGAGAPISYRQTYWAYFITQLSKYLPGGIWIFPGRAVALQRHNVSFMASSVGMFVELTLLILAGISLFVPYWLVTGPESTSIEWWWLGLATIPLVVFVSPPVFNNLLKRSLPLLGQPDVRVHLTFGRLATILAIDILFWLTTGAGFFLLVASLQPATLPGWMALTSAFSMAWVVGFLAFLTPAGLGVREGALALLLAPLLPPPFPALVALLARLWWTAAEGISVGIAALLGRDTAEDTPQS